MSEPLSRVDRNEVPFDRDVSCPGNASIDAFVARACSDAAFDRLERHLAGCPACCALVADAARGGNPDRTDTPTLGRIGRYVLLSCIGRGATAMVYSAYDPRLDRKVALKVHLSTDPASRQRSLREAQALARVDHPNVLRVFDVSSSDNDEVYIAMELVEGSSLRRWLSQRRRSWRQILPLLVGAGNGLAAIHEAGIVHRDFKPDNVLVDIGGIARVGDLGLAATSPVATAGRNREVGDPDLELTATLTRTGAVLGTPAYMSPEHFDGGPLDAAADQFGFCVMAVEALSGRRPFAGSSYEELREAVRRGPDPLGTGGVPRSLWAALERGLRPLPDERHPSMQALLRALERAAGQRARYCIGIGATAAGLLSLALGVAAISGPGTPNANPACEADNVLERHWGADVQDEVRSAFRRVSPQRGREAEWLVREGLADYAARWEAAYGQRCRVLEYEYAHQAEFDSELRCLESQLEGFYSRLDVIKDRVRDEALDAETIDAVLSMVREQPSPRDCEDGRWPLGGTTPSGAPVAITRRLEAVRTLNDLGQHAEALERLAALAGDVRDGHPRVRIEFDLLAAAVKAKTVPGDALPSANAALTIAISSESSMLVGQSLMMRGVVLAILGRFAEAIEATELAEIALSSQLAPVLARAKAALVRADALRQLGRHGEALEVLRRPDDRRECSDSDALICAEIRAMRGVVLLHLGRNKEADVDLRAATAALRRQLGARHPKTIAAATGWSNVLWQTRRYGEAASLLDETCGDDGLIGSLSAELAGDCWGARALVFQYNGDSDRARVDFRRSIDVRERAFGRAAAKTIIALKNLAVLEAEEGRAAEAASLMRRVLAAHREAGNHEGVASAAENLGAVFGNHGQIGDAVAAYEQSLQFAVSPNQRVRSRVGLAQALSQADRDDEAMAAMEQALVDSRAEGVWTETRIRVRWLLAKPLGRTRDTRRRALALATEALADARHIDDRATAETIERWIRELPMVE